MSMKMEPALRDQIMAKADRHWPAAQIIRELMRVYIANNEIPIDGEDVRFERIGTHPDLFGKQKCPENRANTGHFPVRNKSAGFRC